MASAQVQRLPVLGAIGHFAAHFMEMCVAMCVGGIILSIAVFQGLEWLANINLAQRLPELAILLIGLNLAVAMGAWMALRGHPWRHNIEMSATSILAAVLVVAAYEAGLVPTKSLAAWYTLFAFQCGPSCLLMAADMGVNVRHYIGGQREP